MSDDVLRQAARMLRADPLKREEFVRAVFGETKDVALSNLAASLGASLKSHVIEEGHCWEKKLYHYMEFRLEVEWPDRGS
jgi:hypothetical protein